MNRTGFTTLCFFIALVCGCTKSDVVSPENYACTLSFTDSSSANPAGGEWQDLLDDITSSGVPGISMSICTPAHGEWLGSSGMADIASGVELKPCHITRTGSTVKTFTAVTILLLKEAGLLALDDKVSMYLTPADLDKLENADRCTIRQLLNHSSGIFNYIQSLRFQTASVNDLTRVWQPAGLLEYARGKAAYFNPGEDVRYSNTNYVLLGMIIEKVTGKPFYKAFEEMIFGPLRLNSTQFAAENPVPDNLIRGYIDFYSNLQLIESTHYSGWDYYTADGGLISTPHDLSVFMRALFEGNLLSADSMEEMLTVQVPRDPDPDYYPIAYGLGIFRVETPYGIAWNHSGDAIGYFAQMNYFPESQTTLVFAANGNYGKIDPLISSKDALDKIFSVVFENR